MVKLAIRMMIFCFIKINKRLPLPLVMKVEVFLYRDPKGRLTASMRLPAMKVGQIGYVEVINTTNFGCFVEGWY